MPRVPPGGGVVPLPAVPTPGAAGDTWQRVDVYRAQQNGIIKADGTLTVSFEPLDSSERWHISRAVIVCDGTITPAPIVRFHIVQGGNPPSDLTLASGSSCGLFDEADYNAADGLVVFPGEQLLVIWAGAPVGATAVATVQFELYTRAG